MVRNDFTCLSKKCDVEGAATVYEDLPSTTTRCPVCGSKRIRKIYSAQVNTSGVAKHVDAALERSGLREQQAVKDGARKFESDNRKLDGVVAGWSPRDAVVSGPASQMGTLIARATGPWATAPNGQNPFQGAAVGPANKAASVDGLAIHNGSSGRTPMPTPNAGLIGGKKLPDKLPAEVLIHPEDRKRK